MVSRLLVPIDAKIAADSGHDGAPEAARPDLLVPRHLIPTGSKIEPISRPSESAGQPRSFMVAKRLVPANARIGEGALTVSGAARAAAQQEDVFKEAILPTAPMGHRRSLGEWMISVGVHVVIVGGLVIAPLFFAQTLDLNAIRTTFLIAPPVPAAAPPPPPPAAAAVRQPAQVRRVVAGKLTMPIAIPKAIVTTPSTGEEYEAPLAGVPGGVPGGIPGGEAGGILGGIAGGILTGAEVPPPPPPAVSHSKPLHVGGEVKPPHLIHRTDPNYPPLAMQAQVQGDVEIDAIIDVNGNVVEMHAVSGPPLLIPAALRAVGQWKYEPTYLNGEPYAIELTVHVTFQLA